MQPYQCFGNVVSFLEKTNASLHALRLAHACIALTAWHPVRQVGTMLLDPDLTWTVRCLDVANAAFPASLKDHGPLREAISELLRAKDLFERLEIDDSGRNLTYRFSRALMQEMRASSKAHGFFMLRPMELATLSSSRQVLFYTRVELVRATKRPGFLLPGIDGEEACWKATNRQWLLAARAVAKKTGDRFMFSPKRERFTNHVESVSVKFSVPGSQWSPGALYARQDRDLPTLVDASGHRKLSKAEFARRANWTQIEGP